MAAYLTTDNNSRLSPVTNDTDNALLIIMLSLYYYFCAGTR